MHTTPTANLPFHPTSADARSESHGEEFSIHLREDVRKNPASDEPRRPDHETRCCRDERPRAPEKEHQRLSSDDETGAVASSDVSEDRPVAKDDTDLPDPESTPPEANTPLVDQEPATKSAAPENTNTALVEGEIDGLDGAIPPSTNTGITMGQATPHTVSATPEIAVAESGSVETTEAGDDILLAVDPGSNDDAALLAQKAPVLAVIGDAAIQPSETPVANTSAIPAANVISENLLTEGDAAIQGAAKPIIAAAGARSGGSNAAGLIDGQAGPTAGEADGEAQSGETDSLSEIIAGATNKSAAGNNAASAGTGAGSGTVAGSTAAASATADPALSVDSSIKDMPSPLDLAAKVNEPPALANTANANQNGATSTAAAFGSELKMTGEPSLAAETAAARNTPNAAANQVAVQINRAVQDGLDKFVVNLKPGTLGKVSVQLEVGHDHRIIAVISAERPDTLELLQRDARTLELALKEAGLKPDSGSLSFSLQGNDGNDNPFDDPSGTTHTAAISHEGDEGDDFVSRPYQANTIDASGVDIHV